ncbi:phytoene/squalene synthase family protein [Miltoncostaea marina]|uniref:phytoene/squalene synthase family protein n=1 Tax=Miltoncostaea marina TaxID=2843215 RepID=UPI001C3DA23D|nr:squalene/phytoene synthase family protein [Miltoncostaea marina]
MSASSHALAAPTLGEARATTRRVARTFALACRMLPGAVRDDVYMLYLVFRTLDDLVDERRDDAAARVAAVEAWARGEPPAHGAPTPEVAILDRMAARHPLPRWAFADFCAGMRADVAGEAPADEAEVDRYCYRVAGTVGVVMSRVLGARDQARADAAAVTLGQAMQRTNILRDIDEDAAGGRVYVAEGTLRRFGGPAALAPGARDALLRDQIARADALYRLAIPEIAQLRRGRRAIASAAAMYREILRQIEREGYGARAGRAVVPRGRRLVLAARAGALLR